MKETGMLRIRRAEERRKVEGDSSACAHTTHHSPLQLSAGGNCRLIADCLARPAGWHSNCK